MTREPGETSNWMPDHAPLEVVPQRLGEVPRKAFPERRGTSAQTWLLRALIFGGALLLTALGGWQMYLVIAVASPITPLQWLLLSLFVINVSWITLAFTSALAGFLSLLMKPAEAALPLPDRLVSKTAILMPIYNEPPERIFGAALAMAEGLSRYGMADRFDLVFLSDSTDASIWLREEQAFRALRQRLAAADLGITAHYRHRTPNTGRKAGNLAAYLKDWGAAPDHFIVLDADSVMTPESLIGLAAMMEREPQLGIVQTLPLITQANTIFAKSQQLAARIYGPVIAEGLRLWMANDGNYWGHNAIIRTKAFAAHCILPQLSGAPPFGGHILSHDFVEAALMRRAGYEVRLLRGTIGSYEEGPPGILELAARDRRWAQGNLQHLRVILSRGFTLGSRQHFATGIFAYLASPLWLLQLLIGLLIILQATYLRPEYFTSEFTLFPDWPRFDAERSLWLLGGTMAVLLAPKLFGLVVALADSAIRRGCGGAGRLLLSGVIEIMLSALLAPVMLLIQCRSVYDILTGGDSGWSAQRRSGGSSSFRHALRNHLGHTIFGAVLLASALVLSPILAAWMAPTIAGLLLSAPLSHLTSLALPAAIFRRFKLLLTPEENEPPAILTATAEERTRLAALLSSTDHPLLQLLRDPALLDQHRRALPIPQRPRGAISPERAVAEAKISEARSQREAAAWLQPRETALIMADPSLLRDFAALPES